MRWLYLAVICVFAAAVIIFAAQNLETVAMPFLGFSATQFRHTRQSAASSQLRYELQTGRRSDYLATRSSRKANRNCVGTRLSQTRGASQTSWSAEVMSLLRKGAAESFDLTQINAAAQETRYKMHSNKACRSLAEMPQSHWAAPQ